MAASASTSLPPWLQDHCHRLTSVSSNQSCHFDSVITNLNLNLRRLDFQMMEALVEALAQNNQIRIINLTSTLATLTNTTSDHTLIPLSNLMRLHSSLEVVHLSYNRLVNALHLGQALATNTCLVELYLDHNQLTDDAAIAIAQGLLQNPNTRLQVLYLNSNQIGDSGGEAIGNLLKTNTSIKRLDLTKNHRLLGSRTANMFSDALETNMTLVELSLDENPNLQHATISILQLVQANRAGRYLLHHFPTPPIGLWPMVLEGLESDTQYFFLQERPTLVGERMLDK